MYLKFHSQKWTCFFIFLIGIVKAHSSIADNDTCQTPNNDAGLCINIKQCVSLLNLLRTKPILRETQKFLRQSQCGWEGQKPKVCCPNTAQIPNHITSSKPPTSEYQEAQIVKSELLPNESVCGKSGYYKIFQGDIAFLDEFPFMALLEYQILPNVRRFLCGGVLINKRYVLTAAHCVFDKENPKSPKLFSVRLGEFDISVDGMDCVDDGFVGGKYCSLPPINVRIEQAIPHPNYKPTDINRHNDIALLRLTEDVQYTDFVGPICLPQSIQDIKKVFEGKSLYVAGWGTSSTRFSSTKKSKLRVPLINTQRCIENNRSNIHFSTSQICVGGERGKDSCRGDSGGPLMVLDTDSTSWYAVGVLSIEPVNCDLEGWPGVYTRVVDYMNWIVNTIEP